MKKLDLLRLSIKTLRARFAAMYICLTLLGACCFYFACATMYTIWTEKSEPCEIEVASTAYKELSAETGRELMEIPDVLAVTNIIELPVKLTVGKYEAEVTLIGIDPSYLNVQYTGGNSFPEKTLMPWIVLSEKSLTLFRDPSDATKRAADYIPPVDWLEDDFRMTIGDTQLVSKVSGICKDEGGVDAGYLNVETAKSVLQAQGEVGSYTSAVMRIKNIGAAPDVTRRAEALGYAVTEWGVEQQTRWELLQKEALYLLFLGVAMQFAALHQQKIECLRKKRKEKYQIYALRWMGMSEATLRHIRLIQDVFLSVVGVSFGIGTGYIVPRLLYVAEITDVVFTFKLPPVAGLICWAICIAGVFFLSWLARYEHRAEATDRA